MADIPSTPERTSARPQVALLRPALELSWAVAKVGSQARPPLPVPGRLRPIMRVARLPDRMLETVRQVVDEDDEFRERVVAAADEAILGRAHWLWLVRPDGWEAELTGLASEAADAETEQQQKRDAQAAARQIAELTSALQRLQAELVNLKAANDELRDAAARQKKEYRAGETEAGDLRRRLGEAESEVDRMSAIRDGLEEALAGKQAELDDALTGRADDQLRLSELERVLDASAARADEAELRARLAEAEVSRLRARLSRAEAGARALADDIAGDASTGGAGGPRAEEVGGGGEDRPAVAGQPAFQERGGGGGSRRRRAPLRLPPATFEDSPEAASYLVRVPRVLLAVDGYNVTLTSWPSLDLPEQRARLVDSLAELVMRAGTEILVVFDGVDSGNRLHPPPAVRGKLRVQFSPSEIEADDVIIGTVESVPIERPVVVATDDQRVRRTAAQLGANVISVDQLLAVLGRSAAT